MNSLFMGALYILLAATAYACMGALVKFGGNIPDQQLVFFRNAICLILLIPTLFFPQRKTIRTDFFPTHLIRASAGLLNMYCFFYSIRFILLSDAMLLNNTMPLFIPLVMWIWKGQKTSISLIPGLILGFLGIVLILHPTREIFHLGALIALASGIFMSISMAGIRELSKVEPIYKILFYYFAISTCVSFVPLLWSWEFPSLYTWGILIGVGVFAAIYQYLLTRGYEKAPASKVSPFIYFAVVLSGVFDWAFWNHRPDIFSLIGLILVCIGAVICIRSEAAS